MKQILTLVIVCLSATASYSQDYMEKIINQSCECLGQVPDTLKSDEYSMKLGVCMIEASMPYKRQLKKEYDIDLNNINEKEGEKLGRIIGIKMATICPNSVLKLTKRTSVNKSPQSKQVQSVEGQILKVENDFFVIFTLKDNAGKVGKYYWLTFIQTEFDLITSASALVGKSVNIEFETQEFFDPKIGEYRQFFVIKKLSKL